MRRRWVSSASWIGLITACAHAPTDSTVLPSGPAIVPSIRLVTTETPLGTIEGINWSSLLICGKHERIAYAARRGKRWVVIVDGVAGKEYDQLTTFDWRGGELNPGFSPDCKRIAHTGRRDKEWLLVVNGVEGEGFESIVEGGRFLGYGGGWVAFSSDSKHIGHTAKQGGRWFEVVDGVVRSESESTRAPSTPSDPTLFSTPGLKDLGSATSPDGQRIARIQTRNNERFLVVDGKELKKYQVLTQGLLHKLAGLQTSLTDSVEAEEVLGNGPYGQPIFSPDSQRLAYVVQWGDKDSVVVDEIEHAAYERYNSLQDYILVEVATGRRGYWSTHEIRPNLPAFSPDSRHIAYLARRGDKYFVVVDGVEGLAYDVIRYRDVPTLPPPSEHPKFFVSFDGPTRLHTLAVRDGRLIRVEVEIVGE